MKSNIYRSTLLSFLTGCLGLEGYFLYVFCVTNPEYAPKILTILATLFLIFINVFEIISLFKGFKNEKIIIHDLVYEEKNINKVPMIINNIFLFFGLTFIITFVTLIYCVPKYLNIYYFFIELGVFLSINCIYYDLYVLLHNLEEKEQLRLIGR